MISGSNFLLWCVDLAFKSYILPASWILGMKVNLHLVSPVMETLPERP